MIIAELTGIAPEIIPFLFFLYVNGWYLLGHDNLQVRIFFKKSQKLVVRNQYQFKVVQIELISDQSLKVIKFVLNSGDLQSDLCHHGNYK